MLEKRTIDISTGIIFRTILILLGIWFLYTIRDVLALFFIAVILAAAIDPTIDRMQKMKIPRSIGVLVIYLILFLVFGTLISFLIPPIVAQFRDFSENFPSFMEKFSGMFRGVESYVKAHGITFNTQEFIQNLAGSITKSPQGIFSKTAGVFSGFVSVIVVLSLTFYMSVKEDGMRHFLSSVVPSQHREYAISLAERIKLKIGRWMQGQLVLMLFIFILDFIGLWALGVPYALILAILAGILEVIPYLGPILSTIPGVLLGFLISPFTGLMVLLLYIIVQQVENHIVVPQVMNRAVGLNPVAVILALLIGLKLGEILGAILAVPIATTLSVFAGDILEKKESA